MPNALAAPPAPAPRLAALSGEGALDVYRRALALEAAGRSVIHLELGAPDADAPPHVTEAAVAALRAGDARYTAPGGLPELREAVAADLAARGVAADPGQVLVTPSAKTAVFYAMLAAVRPGDEVLVPDPGFPIYPSMARFAGGVPVGYAHTPDGAPDLDDLAARVTPRTRVVALNSPANPTGGALGADALGRLAELAERHDLVLVTDDIYARLVYAPGALGGGAGRAPSVAAHPAARDRTLLVDGFSKTYAMTGYRLGYLVAPPAWTERLVTLAVNGHTCVPPFVQRAGVAALTGPQDAVAAQLAAYRARRDRLVAALNAIPDVRCAAPAGAFYAFPDFSAVLAPRGLSSRAFADRLLDDHGVAAIDGAAFGPRGEGHLRFSFASAQADLDAAGARRVARAAAAAALAAAAPAFGAAAQPAARPAPPPPDTAAAAPDRRAFAALLDEHWRWFLRGNPVLATSLGERAYDRELGDLTLAGMGRRAREAAALLARFDRADTAGLTATDRATRAVVRRALAEQAEGARYGQRAVLFTTYAGWHTEFADLPDTHPFRDRADYEAYVARLNAFPAYNRGAVATTRWALAGGFAQPCAPLAGYARTISGSVADDPARSRFLEPFARRPATVDSAAWAGLRGRALAAVRDSVVPAYRALLDFYQGEYAPRCRAAAGVAATPGGAAYYAFRVRSETTTDLTPAQVHALGLAEVARIGAAMDALARAAGHADRRAYVARLRADPRHYARTPDELLAAASVLAKRIDGEMPRHFGRLPRLPYTVRPVPAAVAEGTTTAYYGPGSPEGGRPGTYWVNTSKLDQRPLYELPALTLHEAVPGHHHQIALAQELDLPPFRRHGAAFAAFSEGWALYAESLGEAMGLYDTPERRMGRLSYEMWRACRLVVDTGIHAYGWPRDSAVAYMLARTALSRANVEAEVNRYVTWPGQATAYKVGELRIRALRARAEQALGDRFDPRAFHDAVLELGPVPLDVLEAHVRAWVTTVSAAAPGAR